MAVRSENILSASDSRILNTIFDPEAAPTTQTVTIDPTLPPDPHIPSPILPTLQATEARAIRAVESCQASSVGGGEEEEAGEAERKRDEAYASALAALTALISAHPAYASARNNRAQLRRWRFGDARLAGDPARAADAAAVLADLDAALALATPAAAAGAAGAGGGGGRGAVRVGARQAAVLRGAWAQRGAVMLAAARGARAGGGTGDGARGGGVAAGLQGGGLRLGGLGRRAARGGGQPQLLRGRAVRGARRRGRWPCGRIRTRGCARGDCRGGA